MRILPAVTLFMTAFALSAHADVGSPFKGYDALNSLVRDRLIAPGKAYDVGSYLGSSQLESLLGTYQSNGLNQLFVNGSPNVLNMVLYHLALSGLAGDIGGLCGQPSTSALAGYVSADFQAALTPLCAWPAPSAKTGDVLLGFYTAVMSFDAPPEEYQAWSQFFLGPDFSARTAKDTVTAMSLTLLLNPYFLLQN
jgi:hypothetical protein